MRFLSSCDFRGKGAAPRRSRIDPVGVEGEAGGTWPAVCYNVDYYCHFDPDVILLCCLQDASARCLAIEPTADVLDGVLIEAGGKAALDVADEWPGQQVRQRAERMVERQRLLVKDIDGSTGDPLGFGRGI